jgi:hypothetical protein
MKILNREKCAFILKLNPFELDIIAFFRIPALWWFCYKSTLLLVMNLKLSVKVFTKLKTPPSLYGLQFLVLDTMVGCVVRFIDYLWTTRHITLFTHLMHPRFPKIMNYHYGITQNSTCNCNSLWSLSISWIKASLIMKSMLPLPPYQIIYCYVVSN